MSDHVISSRLLWLYATLALIATAVATTIGYTTGYANGLRINAPQPDVAELSSSLNLNKSDQTTNDAILEKDNNAPANDTSIVNGGIFFTGTIASLGKNSFTLSVNNSTVNMTTRTIVEKQTNYTVTLSPATKLSRQTSTVVITGGIPEAASTTKNITLKDLTVGATVTVTAESAADNTIKALEVKMVSVTRK